MVKEVEATNQEHGWGTPHDRTFKLDTAGRKYDAMMKGGRMRSAVHIVSAQDLGRLYRPSDKCSKTGRPVIEILRDKHPKSVIPDTDHFDIYSDIITNECQTSMPIYCSEDEVAKGSNTLGGCTGPTGVDGLMLQGWVLRKDVPSEKFCEKIARWVMLI